MALSWVLLPIVFVIFSSCQGVEYGWLPQKEFLFSVQGKDLAGLPQLKSQYAGFSYSGELRVQSHSPRILLFKLLKMNYTKIHEELPEGWWNGPDNDSRNKTKSLPLTTSTVVVKLSKSRSPEILMETTLHDWQVNFIKGLVSKVVAYLSDNPVSGPNSKKLYSSRQPDVFSVVEDSVVGRCEVLYEVSPLPTMLGLFTSKMCDNRQMWEITKTYNFSNCQILSEDHAHVPSKDCTPGGANCGQFWSRASLTQMVGCGEMNNFILLSSITSSVINAHLHLQNDSQAVLNSNLNITLTSLMDLKQKFNAPQNKQSFNSLLYTYTKTSKDLYSRTCQDTAGSNSGEEKSTNDLEFNENSNLNEGYNSRGEPDNVQRRGRDKRGLKKKYGQGLKTKSYGQSNEDEPSNYRPNNNDNSNYQ